MHLTTNFKALALGFHYILVNIVLFASVHLSDSFGYSLLYKLRFFYTENILRVYKIFHYKLNY